MKRITYTAAPGSHISGAVQEISRISKQQHALVRLNFNDVILVAAPKKSPVTLLWEFSLIQGYKSDAYKHSCEYRKQKEARRLEVQRHQRATNAAITCIQEALSKGDQDDVIRSLGVLAASADDIDVHFDRNALRIELCAAGYARDAHVGQKPEWFNTRDRLGRYIIGQVLECLFRGMPPHPVTTKFVEDYFKLPSSHDIEEARLAAKAAGANPEGGAL